MLRINESRIDKIYLYKQQKYERSCTYKYLMATQCNLAPFINQEFLVTGAWGEPRTGHIHARSRFTD